VVACTFVLTVTRISIILASISFVGSVVSVALTSWLTYLTDQRTRRHESEQLVAKYRDPLLLAAHDLQSRLHNITDWTVTDYFAEPSRQRDNFLLYTAYVIGQYLCWTHILRRKLQFLRTSTDEATKDLDKALAAVVEEFSTDHHSPDGMPFMLWRGEQMAIGQRMTENDGDELFAIGYAEFCKRCKEDLVEPLQSCSMDPGVSDGDFITWFRSILQSTAEVAKARLARNVTVPDQRLRRLQHLVMDLIRVLDPQGLRVEASVVIPSTNATDCICSSCSIPSRKAHV